MVSIKTILCPVDFSEISDRALAAATELAVRWKAELHLLHVFEGYNAIVLCPELAMTRMGDWLPKLREVCREKLAELPRGKDLESLKVVRANREGSAVHEIVDYAKAHHVDLIVLGTHGRTGLSHLVIGSVAENVVRLAPCAVLTVPPADHQASAKSS